MNAKIARCKSTEARALKAITAAGGRVTDREVVIPLQAPKPPPLEQCSFGIPVKLLDRNDAAWTWQGNWQPDKDTKVATGAGSEASLRFAGTGIALVGPLSQEGGRADVFIDGVKQSLTADAYIVPNTNDNDLWHVFGLTPGEHTLRLVLRDDADPRSKGKKVTIQKAIAYATQGGL